VVMSGGITLVRVGTAVLYAAWVHDGTGLYGPRHRMIVPVNKKVLRWKAKGGAAGKNGYVFSRHSRGMKPNHFLKDALPAFKA